MSQRILRPLSYGDLLDEIFDLYQKNFTLFAGIAGIVYIPVAIISAFVTAPFSKILTDESTTKSVDPSAMINQLIPMFSTALIAGLFYTAALGAMTWAISKTYLGQKPTILSSYKAIMPRMLPLIITGIIVCIMVIVGLAFCYLPGLVLMIFLAFTIQVVTLENKGYFKAIGRTFELSTAAFWRVLVIGFLAWILSIFVQIVLLIAFVYISQAAVSNPALMSKVTLLNGITSGIAVSLILPISTSALVLLYYDVRVRKEGFDVEMLAEGIGAEDTSNT